jgi:hypothetical protein
MESDEEALVKEERWPQAIAVAVPPPSFLRQGLLTLCLGVFNLHLRVL